MKLLLIIHDKLLHPHHSTNYYTRVSLAATLLWLVVVDADGFVYVDAFTSVIFCVSATSCVDDHVYVTENRRHHQESRHLQTPFLACEGEAERSCPAQSG